MTMLPNKHSRAEGCRSSETALCSVQREVKGSVESNDINAKGCKAQRVNRSFGALGTQDISEEKSPGAPGPNQERPLLNATLRWRF